MKGVEKPSKSCKEMLYRIKRYFARYSYASASMGSLRAAIHAG
jgi:hypothetical protein